MVSGSQKKKKNLKKGVQDSRTTLRDKKDQKKKKKKGSRGDRSENRWSLGLGCNKPGKRLIPTNPCKLRLNLGKHTLFSDWSGCSQSDACWYRHLFCIECMQPIRLQGREPKGSARRTRGPSRRGLPLCLGSLLPATCFPLPAACFPLPAACF